MKTNQRGRAFALAAFLSAAIAVPAIAAEPDAAIPVNGNRVTQSRAVSVADLDLSTAQGQRALDHRIKLAVNDVCSVFDVSLIRDQNGFVQCARAAHASARAQITERQASNDTRPITVVTG